jgi:hypothetical protein
MVSEVSMVSIECGARATRAEPGEDARVLLEELNRWTLDDLTRANRAILAGRRSLHDLVAELRAHVLTPLPRPELFTPSQAQRVLVTLGLAGASVARHYQESDITRKAEPERSFQALPVGQDATPFPAYFARLATVTGAGHCPRDCFASLVRWNAPTTEVALGATILATLPGCFSDQSIRTYTADAGETAFFELLKKSEALEAAANAMLWPLAERQVDMLSPDATHRAALAASVLKVLIRLNADFAARSPERGGLHPDHFMDVFRQFAVHWRLGDIPPSGAQDPEFLLRDLLLGIDLPDYPTRIRRMFPVLLDDERARLERQMQRTPLPEALLQSLNLSRAALAEAPPQHLSAILAAHPELAIWHELLAANARMAAVHLKLTERFMFGPQRIRDTIGIGDRLLVSNRRGTTDMDETMLIRLARARRRHILASLERLPAQQLRTIAGSIAHTPAIRVDGCPTVRFVATGVTRSGWAAPVEPMTQTIA